MRRIAVSLVGLLLVQEVAAPVKARADYNSSAAESESTTYTTASAAIALGVAAVVAAVVFVVVLVQRNRYPRAEAALTPAERAGAALIEQSLYGSGTLTLVLTGLIESPAAMDALTQEAATGSGPHLETLARATAIPVAVVAEMWTRTVGAPAATRDEAFSAVVRFVEGIGPRLHPDADSAELLLLALADEQALPDFPVHAPAHARLAEWTGVPVADLAPLVSAVLAHNPAAPSRAWLHAHAVDLAAELGASLGGQRPDAIRARAAEVVARGKALGVHVDGVALADP